MLELNDKYTLKVREIGGYAAELGDVEHDDLVQMAERVDKALELNTASLKQMSTDQLATFIHQNHELFVSWYLDKLRKEKAAHEAAKAESD